MKFCFSPSLLLSKNKHFTLKINSEENFDMELLQVKELAKDYHSRGKEPFRAVNGISFSVNKGECFGLLGPNGAGKSTTMKCITGFYPLNQGQVLIKNIDI